VAGSRPVVGVLALQGAVREHIRVLEGLGAEARPVKRAHDLDGLWGIVLPGGESTTIGMLMGEYGLREPLGGGRLPVFGTCAGLILMARRLQGGEPPWLAILDVTVVRNAYGRQGESHEADIDVAGIGRVRGVFIRAPYISEAAAEVEVLARDDAGHPVVVRQGAHLGAAFHPELAGEGRLHAAFLAGLAGPVEATALVDRRS
jgi:pyridoxal 5'-phosphate synthase pdxT subunit